jgi:hypothetical protein
MHSTDTISIPDDIDAILVDSVPINDGIWAWYGFDDDRPLAAWSSFHATRCMEQLPIARARVKAAEWALADVQARGVAPAIAKASAHLARTRSELADWEAQARRLEAARKVTYGAWQTPLIDG